jgi:CRP/FNR family transcriptional regulator
VFAEGTDAIRAYSVTSGAVKLIRVNAGGREHVTAVLRSGDLFGLEAIFDERYRVSAETLTDCNLCGIPRHEMERLVAGAPGAALYLAEYLHHQLTRTRDRQMSLGALTAVEKFAGYLLQDIAPDGEPQSLANHLTLKELGGVLGLSPETVCRVRSELIGQGIIEVTSTGISVRDVASLKRLAGLRA